MNFSDQIIDKIEPQICFKHNQPIVSYYKKNKPLCFTCLLELSNIMPVEQIQQQLKESIRNSDIELDGQRQIFCAFMDSLNFFKNDLISELDKTIQILIDQIKSIDQQKEQLRVNVISSVNYQQSIQNLQNEFANSHENYLKFRSFIIKKLHDFKQKFENIDHSFKLINVKNNIKQSKLETEPIGKKFDFEHTKIKQEQIMTKFEYQLIKDQIINLQNDCNAFAFNNNNSILLVGCETNISIYKLENGKIGKELSRLNQHTKYVTCFYFMKLTNSFISGSDDTSIIVWSGDKNNQWVVKQKITDHTNYVNCILMNKSEELLISGSSDQNIKFWDKQNDLWNCKQSIVLEDRVYAISLNEAEDKLISCGMLQKIYIMEIQNDYQWALVQKIDTCIHGLRLSFTFENQFAFQPFCKDFLEIYDYDGVKQKFQKVSNIQVQNQDEECWFHFPCQYIKQLSILIVKNGKYLNIFKVNKDGKYQLMQTIQYQNFFLFGIMSDNGEYLVTWNETQKQVQLRRLILLE